MNKKLKQKILKEINYLLKEQSSQLAPLKAGAATAGLGVAGAAGLGALTGAGKIAAGSSLALGAGGGGAGAGALGGLAIAAWPLAITSAAVVGIYNIFRKAGWQEVAQDIQDASDNMQERPELAAKLPTNGYFDLTTMKDATDKEDFESLMTAMEQIRGAISDQPNLEGIASLLGDLRSQKPILDKLCGVKGTTSKGGYVLLNEFGLNDRMYHVKCARIAIKDIPEELIKKLQSGEIKLPEESGSVEEAATSVESGAPLPESENVQEALRYLKKLLREAIDTTVAATQPAAAPAAPLKCSDSAEVFFIPVSFDTVGLEDEIADAPVRIKDRSLPPEEPIISPLIEKICQLAETIKPTPGPQPVPQPDDGGVTAKVSCVRCRGVGLGCKGPAVKEIHDKLIALKLMNPTNPSQGNVGMSMGGGEIQLQLFGKATEEAVKNFQKFKKLKIDGVVGKNTSKAMGIECISGGGGGDTGGGGGDKKSGAKCPPGTAMINGTPSVFNIYGIKYTKLEPTQPDNSTQLMCANLTEIEQKNDISDADQQGGTPPPELVYQVIDPASQKFFQKNLEESKQFKYEKYYDNKKEKEAKLLFEKLIKKI